MDNGFLVYSLLPLKKSSATCLNSRVCAVLTLLLVICASAGAGEIVVYTQVWRGKTPSSYVSSHKGKGYILIDFENRSVTRISSEVGDFQKIFRIENYTSPVLATFIEPSSGKEWVAVQASRREQTSGWLWERTVVFKGRTALQQIGPSQQKRVPKLLSGLRRMTEDFLNISGLEEDSFSATFSQVLTNDTNANSRTLQQEVELLAESLEQAGYSRTGTE